MLRAVKAAESRSQATKCADERKLRRDEIDYETEAGFLSKRQALLGLALHVDEVARPSRGGSVIRLFREYAAKVRSPVAFRGCRTYDGSNHGQFADVWSTAR